MYLLDTNILIYAKQKRNLPLRDRIRSHDSALLHISIFTVAELIFGCAKSKDPVNNKRALMEFLLPFTIVNFDQSDCNTYGKVRAYLETGGQPIGTVDTFIGALALSRKFTLVTNNEKEFNRIPGLRIENWA